MEESLQSLKNRLSIASMVIDFLERSDDPRAPAALERYREQRAEIERRIRVAESRPPDIVIGLKPAILTGKTR